MRTERAGALALTFVAALGLIVMAAAAHAGPAEQAQKAFDKGEYDKAADLFAKAVQAKPTNREAVLGMARASVKAERQDLYYDALDALGVLMKANEKDLDVQVAMGEVNIAIANTKSDPQALKGYFADAQAHFETAIEIEPTCEDAVVGLARSLYFVGDFPGAIRAVDQYLANKPTSVAVAYFWKGQAMYLEAMDAYRSDGHTDDVKQKFRLAQGAYAASTAADASVFDAWLQLAYAAAYSHDTSTANEAYRSAIVADPERAEIALKGLASLHANDKPGYTKLLEALVTKHPKNEHVLLYAAFEKYERRELDEAEALFTRQIEVAKKPASGWYYLGTVAEAKNDHDRALAAYAKALAANNDYPAASGAYGLLLLGGKDPGAISRTISVSDAKDLVKAYHKLFKLAPRDPWIRNNLGLMLRDAWVFHNAGGRDTGWDPLVEAGAEAYESACEIIGEWDDRLLTTLGWEIRYGYAQVISDTGLMFQFHPPIQDFEKADTYYLRSLEYSENGYFDAWNNLRKIYAAQEEWESLYDLAELCADGLVHRDRSPHEEGRAQARATMEKLLESGKVSDN